MILHDPDDPHDHTLQHPLFKQNAAREGFLLKFFVTAPVKPLGCTSHFFDNFRLCRPLPLLAAPPNLQAVLKVEIGS